MSYESEYRKIKPGARVKLRRSMTTRGDNVFPPGTEMIVEKKRGGLHLVTIGDGICPTCNLGQRRRLYGVSLHDVEVLQNG